MSDGVFLLGLVFAAVLVATRFLGRLRIPAVPVMVLCGLVLACVPGLPRFDPAPGLALEVLLPPLVYYHAAFGGAPRESRADAAPIVALGVSLTVVTALAAAGALALALPGIGGPAALAIGAALAPTDASAVRLVLPRCRVATVLEGESLLNEAVALVLFSMALHWAEGSGGIADDLPAGILELVGGAAFGLGVAWGLARLRRLLPDPGAQIMVSLATPFLCHHAAERLHLSGPLAVAAAGLYAVARPGAVLHLPGRAAERHVWGTVALLMAGALPLLVGLQTPVLSGLPDHWHLAAAGVLVAAASVVAATVAVRVGWCLAVAAATGAFTHRRGRRPLGWRERLLLGLGSARGPVTLALALALPSASHAVLGVVAAVVLVTGLLQPPLLALAGRGCRDDGRAPAADVMPALTAAALARLDEIECVERRERRAVAMERSLLRLRGAALTGDPREPPDEGPAAYRRIRSEVVRAQREELLALYRHGEIEAETLHEITHTLDAEDPATARPPRP